MKKSTFLTHLNDVLVINNLLNCVNITKYDKVCISINDNFFEVLQLILNFFGSLGLKFDYITVTENKEIVEIQIIFDYATLKTLDDFFYNN